MRTHDIPFGGICVITEKSLPYPIEILDFFIQNGFSWLGLNIERIEAIHHTSGFHSTDAITNYSNFIRLFYQYWRKNIDKIHIREFSELLESINAHLEVGVPPFLNTESEPFYILKINLDGDVSTFSLFQNPGSDTDFSFGNIQDVQEFDQFFINKKMLLQYQSIQSGINQCKETCKYYSLCGGGSPPAKYYENGTFDSAQTLHCLTSTRLIVDMLIKEHANTLNQR